MLSRPEYIYILGDSHALVFGGRIIEVSASAPAVYSLQTIFTPGIRAEWFAQEDGDLGAPITSALLSQRILVTSNGINAPYHTVQDQAWRASAVLEGRLSAPSLALSCGGFDVMDLIWNLPSDDIALPEDLADRFDVPDVCRAARDNALSWEEAMKRCRALLAPIEIAFAHLQRMQLRSLMVLSLTPPTLNDALFKIMASAWGYAGRGPRLLTPWRYKVALLMNDALREISRLHDVAFINSWNATTQGGLASPMCLQDDTIHLTSEAAAGVITEMIEQARERPRPQADEFARSIEDVAVACAPAVA